MMTSVSEFSNFKNVFTNLNIFPGISFQFLSHKRTGGGGSDSKKNLI